MWQAPDCGGRGHMLNRAAWNGDDRDPADSTDPPLGLETNVAGLHVRCKRM